MAETMSETCVRILAETSKGGATYQERIVRKFAELAAKGSLAHGVFFRDTIYGRPAQQIQQSGSIEVRFSDGTSNARSRVGGASDVAADRLALASGVARGEALADRKGASDRRNGTGKAGSG